MTSKDEGLDALAKEIVHKIYVAIAAGQYPQHPIVRAALEEYTQSLREEVQNLEGKLSLCALANMEFVRQRDDYKARAEAALAAQPAREPAKAKDEGLDALVERLRYQSRYTRGLVAVTMHEAADRLEALAAQPVREELEQIKESLRKQYEIAEHWRKLSESEHYLRTLSQGKP